MKEKPGQTDCSGSEETHVVDRLNPSRNMISSIESEYAEKAENTQKVMVNMMCDLRCELVVTLGDARLSEEQENKLMKEHRDWEEFKVGGWILFLSCSYFNMLRRSTSGDGNHQSKSKSKRRNQ